MFWLWRFWTFLFGSGAPTTDSTSTANFEYNGYIFWSSYFRLTGQPDIESAGSILFETYDIALSNGGGDNGYRMKPKKFIIEWSIVAESASDLEDKIDELKYAMLQSQKKFTYIKKNGVVVEAIASCTRLDVNRKPYHITFVPVQIEFTVLDPFFYGAISNEHTDYGNIIDFFGTVTNDKGHYETLPKAFITYNSASSCTSLSFTLNGQTIIINHAFTNGDIIVIDSKNKEVTINSVEGQDYLGEFATLPLWEISYSVDSNWTFNIDLVIQWKYAYV